MPSAPTILDGLTLADAHRLRDQRRDAIRAAQLPVPERLKGKLFSPHDLADEVFAKLFGGK